MGSIGAALVQGEFASLIDEWLISPMFLVQPADSTLQFRWLGNPTFASNVAATCLVRRKGDITWTSVWSLSQENTGLAFAFPARTVSLGSWLTDSVQVAFRVVGTDGADFGVDDIQTGNFSVTHSASNDKCLSATPLPAGSFSLPGSTCDAVNDLDPYVDPSSCVTEEAGGGDVFYAVNANAGDTLIARIPASSAEYTFLYLLDSCDTLTATCVSGMNPFTGEADGSLTHVFDSSGTYYLVVDALTDACGDFVLTGVLRGSVTAVPIDVAGAAVQLSTIPNPSRNAVTFRGHVLGASTREGKLSVYDTAGRRVWQTTVRTIDGRFTAAWDGRLKDGSRAGSGVYTASAVLGEFRATAQVVMLE